MKTKITLILVFLSALLLQGCMSFNTLADARNGKGSGESREYSADFDTVWQQTLSVVRQSGLSLVNADTANGLILAQQSFSPLSLTAGQNVAIYVTKNGDRTRVEVISRKAVGEVEFVSRDWQDYIIEQLNAKLG